MQIDCSLQNCSPKNIWTNNTIWHTEIIHVKLLEKKSQEVEGNQGNIHGVLIE